MAHKEKQSLPSRAVRVICVIICIIVALVVLALAIFSLGENIVFSKFYSRADKAFKIPGLWGDSVPQGFEYIDESDIFLYTGYSKTHGEPSMVYIMPDDGEGKSRMVKLYDKDGSAFDSHVGGITIYGDYAYIADGNGVSLFELSDILDNDGKATRLDTIEVDFGVAFVEIKGDRLYVGNFYRAVDYETPESHHITTPNGDNNTAIIYEYEMSPDTSYPKSIYPVSAFSITDAIQGMTFGDFGEIFLSSSWGLSKSHIYVYDPSQASVGTFTTPRGDEIPLTFLDSKCLTDDIIAPPMAEEIVYDEGELYIMGEAASMKYIFGKITGAQYVYAYEYIDD